MKRTPLVRRSELKRTAPKAKARIPQAVRLEIRRRQGGRCLVCGTKRYDAHAHHVLPQQNWPQHAYEANNLVAVCPGCHDNHERAHRRIRYDELPEAVRTWVHTLGGRETLYLERTYPR
jgi:5-methylcytosine-specific restriction endonuclease McrA